MPSKIAASFDEIINAVEAPLDISLDCSPIDKGIDNYHCDVELSEKFVMYTKELVEEQVKLIVAGHRLSASNSEKMGDYRDSYTDMMKVTFYRCKTDLKPSEIVLLQFAVVKFVITQVREKLQNFAEQLEETLGQQQYSGSRSLLATQQRQQWFRKHQAAFQYRVNRLMLRQLQREENNQLKPLRAQVMGDLLPEAINILFNPLLYAASPQDPTVLLENYSVWSKDFSSLNESIEDVLAEVLPELKVTQLKTDTKLSSAETEAFDVLGGLFSAQMLMGPSEDQKDAVAETFSWMEHPGNVRWLFDGRLLQKHLDVAKEEGGLRAGWSLKSDIKKLLKSSNQLEKTLSEDGQFRNMVAGHRLSDLTQKDIEIVDISQACTFVAGKDEKKILSQIDESLEGAAPLVERLKKTRAEYEQRTKEAPQEGILKVLGDLFRYRLHLKYYRFAHRAFNRINVIIEPQQIQLARAGGNLYRLMDSQELKHLADEQPDIAHHTILKADVRGSTTVTQELINKDLNPASYFSLRFFGPINERLAAYGAVKVFIEGDAVILGFYEYEGHPAEWYSVARACGMAKEMIDIVTLKNTDSRKTGLPTLEIGIGICYADERPLFLFDEDRPIMISSAIGDSDRMSSCSWKLRGSFEAGNFNVEVLEIDEGDRQRGEKGRDYLRYDVNGILLDDAAFTKLQSEISLTRINMNMGEYSEAFYIGRFPDVTGGERDLIIRDGAIGIWKDNTVSRGDDKSERFYEVLPNSKFASQLLELANKQLRSSKS